MSNKRKTKFTAVELRQLQDDWDRAAWLERLAVGELTGDMNDLSQDRARMGDPDDAA
jgi:hypothetical protein